jgi:hypothetical protein
MHKTEHMIGSGGRAMPAAIGFTVKSGWAAAVVVSETGKELRVLDSRRVELCDPDVEASKQPYHDGFATMRKPGPTLTRLLSSVRQFGQRSVAQFLGETRDTIGRLSGAGLIVGSLIDPATIGNEHIRIHAMEGKLFREVSLDAAERHGLRSVVWRERDVMANARAALELSDASLAQTLHRCGAACKPWRTEQKRAALAAWLVIRGAS